MLPAAAFFTTNSKPRFLASFLQSDCRKIAENSSLSATLPNKGQDSSGEQFVSIGLNYFPWIHFVCALCSVLLIDQWKTKESKIRCVQYILFTAKWEYSKGNNYSAFQPHSLPVRWRKERTITYLADDTKCRSGVSSTEAVAEGLSQWATWRLRRWQRRVRVAVFSCRLWSSWAIFTLCLAMPQVSNQICVFFIET